MVMSSCVYYVDNMLIIGSDDKMIRATNDMLTSKFDLKDMDLSDVILGIKITRIQNGLVLTQIPYVDKILEKFNQGDTSMARTPIDISQHLSKNSGDNVAQVEYSRIIGSLMYLISCTRHDLAYAISRPSRYTSNLSVEHWKRITKLLRYLRYTREYGLHYVRYPAVIERCSDANWISDIKDSRSTSGYWLRQFVDDILKWPKPVTVICIHCDSQSAIDRAQIISIDYVKSNHNIVDPLTKGLRRDLVYKSLRGMGLKP
ncbi:hypothetical protein OSB04_006864 [Centaurea solstitialis]|uniref:Reverse transcriptase Ty1/copia-type domain-containing protein n=1 Tax=Centaurea solstitialis TaxID=347529 RepID=A0AA38TIS7_9ASTR|nr:hypothetical protein OSB04_006864 [Centaurea solstitialis]